MNILVTGGAGFVGSHIVRAYLNEGYDVFVVDNLSTSNQNNLPEGITDFSDMDVRSPNLEHFIKSSRIDVVNHQAAKVSVRKSMKEPINDAKVNITGTLNLIQACQKTGVRRIIFSSSSAVYGIQDSFPIGENFHTMPISPHGCAKLVCEHYLYAARKTSSINYLSLRCGAIYGPGQNMHGEGGIVMSILRSIHNNKSKIYIHGEHISKDFVYISDVVHANLLAVQHGGGVLNIGSGHEITHRDLVGIISEILEPEDLIEKLVFLPIIKGEPKRMALNSKRAHFALGWTAKVVLQDGIKMAYDALNG